jgi:hypothetical protein
MAKESFWKLFTLGRIEAVTLAGAGKPVVVAGAETIAAGGAHGGHAAAPTILAAFGLGAGNSMAGMALLGGFGVVSAVTNHVEYLHERAEIGHFYREEIAAQNHKKNGHANDYDLSNVENGNARAGVKQNHVIKEAVDRERAHRNLGVAASFIASIAVFTLLEAVGMPHAAIGFSLPFMSQVVVGVLSYLAIKAPLVKAGAALLGLNKETTHERIEEMARDRANGKSITREQVVEVFVSANKELASYVEHTFGKEYEALSLADKVRVAEELSNILPIDKIASSINKGVTNASELAFTVDGQVSGVLPKTPEREQHPSTFQRFAEKCKHMVHSVGHMFHSEKAHPIAEIAAINKAHKASSTRIEPIEDSPIVELNNGRSFVESLGREKQDAGKGHVEQLAERGSQQIAMAGTATLQ